MMKHGLLTCIALIFCSMAAANEFSTETIESPSTLPIPLLPEKVTEPKDQLRWQPESPLYVELIESLYQQREQRLIWFADELAEPIRQELYWQLLEVSLAGGPEQFSLWLQGLQYGARSPAQLDRLYTQAFLGLVILRRSLERQNYAQSSSMAGFDRLSLALPQGGALLPQDMSSQIVYQQLINMRGDAQLTSAVRDHLSHLLLLAQLPWPTIGPGQLIRPQQRDPRISFVRRQLDALTGQVEPSRGTGDYFDEALKARILDFQRQHGLDADGIIGPKTRRWLNLSPLKRARLQARNLLRMRHLEQQLPPEFLLVNLPAYQLRLYSQGVETFQSKVIVGRRSRPTPLLASQVSSVVLNPPWNVPRNILRRDIVPKLRKDPQYLVEQNFNLFDEAGKPIPFEAVDWPVVTQLRQFPYRLQQRPGDGNALGRYKFHFPNRYAVYLHDTSTPALFGETQRSFSSGCVRVEKAQQLADYLLSKTGYPKSYQTTLMESGQTKWLRLAQQLPVFTVYWTAWIDNQGVPQYRQDIYQLDRQLFEEDNFIALRSVLSPIS